MQKLAFNPHWNGYLNHNIEIIRDIAETIGLDRMANAYGNLSFGTTEGARMIIMIESRHYGKDTKYVCVEYEGDGVCHIEPTDSYGNPIDDRHDFNKLFDTHAYYCHNGTSSVDAFHKHLKDKFDIII